MNRDSKMIAIVALVVAVVGLGIGFAAFTASLTIDSSAKVNPNQSNFKVKFKTSTLSCTQTEGEGTATKTGTLEDTSISGVEVELKKPGDSVTCTADITAEGDYTAYLTAITTAQLTCEIDALDNTLGSLGTEACKKIKATFSVGSTSIATSTKESKTDWNRSADTVMDNTLEKTSDTFGTNKFSLKIEYEKGAPATDQPLKITIPQTTLKYETASGISLNP